DTSGYYHYHIGIIACNSGKRSKYWNLVFFGGWNCSCIGRYSYSSIENLVLFRCFFSLYIAKCIIFKAGGGQIKSTQENSECQYIDIRHSGIIWKHRYDYI